METMGFDLIPGKWLAMGITILIILLLRIVLYRLVVRRFNKAGFKYARRKVIRRLMDIFTLLIGIVSVATIFQVNGERIVAYLASFFTVLGVALFAQWSMLSNITAGIILYFNHPIKLGDTITIMDKDQPIVGTVDDITYFFIHIRDANNELFIISNTEMIQKITRVKID